MIHESQPTPQPLFRHLFEQSADAILIISKGKFIDCNPAALRVLGYSSKNDLLDTHPSELSPPYQSDGQPSFEKAQEMMHLAMTHGSHRFEWDHIRANGEVFPVEVLLTPMPFEGEMLLHVVWRDIAKRRASEEALKASEQLFRVLFNNAFQFIGLLNVHGTLLAANQTALSLIGKEEREVVGQPFWETPWWNHDAAEQQKLRRAIEQAARGETARFETRHPTSPGAFVTVDFSIKPVFDPKGNVSLLIPEGRDITEIRRNAARMIQTQKGETLGVLAGGVAHDMNNLLGSMVGALSILQHRRLQGHLEETFVVKTMATIQHACDRATQLTQQLLSLSRESEGPPQPCNLVTLIQRLSAMLEHSLDRSIRMSCSVPETQAMVWGDEGQLEQVMLNLCLNAAHSMTIMREADQAWGGALTLHLSQMNPNAAFLAAHPHLGSGPLWRLDVCDQGVGIPTNQLDLIFQPFFTTKSREEGTGLGLAIIHTLIRQHNGCMEVKSEPGKGSVFSVFLPASPEGPHTAPREDCLSTPQVCRGTLLLVDDEPMIRETIGQMLEELGYQVKLAGDGEEALRLFASIQDRIDGVLLDMVMPKRSGKETYIALREQKESLPVLLISGYEKDRRIQETLHLGAKLFLRKPFDMNQLATSVRALLTPEPPNQ
jgi:PAS domain S-box-containing protein